MLFCFFPSSQHAAREEILANGGSLSHHHGGTQSWEFCAENVEPVFTNCRKQVHINHQKSTVMLYLDILLCFSWPGKKKKFCTESRWQHGEPTRRALPRWQAGSQSCCKCAFGRGSFIASFTFPKSVPAAQMNDSDSAICSFQQWPNETWAGEGGETTLLAPSGLTETAALSILPSASLFSYITWGYSSHLSKTVCSESAAILNHNFSWRRGRVQN